MTLSKIARKFKQINIFITNLGFTIQKPLIIYYNNKNIIAFLNIKKIIYYC